MLESVKYSKCTTKEFLDTLVDADEIYAEYEKNGDIYIECLEKLCNLKEFGLCIKILRDQSKHILDKFEKYEQLRIILSRSLQECKSNGCLDELMDFFWDLLEKCSELFQKYLVCCVISTIVAFEGKFPNKTRAIAYFKVLYQIFESSECFNNYLIVVHYMEKLGVADLSEEEIDFLKACASIKHEDVCKELLCGMRVTDVQKMFENRKGRNRAFVRNENWKKLIEAKKTGSLVTLDIDFVSFLLKNDISFEIKNGELCVGEYRRTGLTGRIFAVAKKYEIRKEPTAGPVATEEVPKESAEKISVKPVVKKEMLVEEPLTAIKYADRFSKARREFMWFYSNCGYVFEDNDLEERNARKKEIFEEMNNEFERKKRVFEEKKELIYQLSEKLKEDVEKKTRKEREESIKHLKEKSLAASTSNKWERKCNSSDKVDTIVGKTGTCGSMASGSLNDIRLRNTAPGSMIKKEAELKRSFINKFNEELKESDSNSGKNKWARNVKK